MVSKARLDLPLPDSPVKTIRASRGRSRLTSRRLCSRAPRTIKRSDMAAFSVRVSKGPMLRADSDSFESYRAVMADDYTGAVTVGGPPDIRDLGGGLRLAKV